MPQFVYVMKTEAYGVTENKVIMLCKIYEQWAFKEYLTTTELMLNDHTLATSYEHILFVGIIFFACFVARNFSLSHKQLY